MIYRRHQIDRRISEALGLDVSPTPQEDGLEKELDASGHEIGPKTVNRDEFGASARSAQYSTKARKKKGNIPVTTGTNPGPAAN